MRHIISVLVNDQPRVLARVANLLGRRNFNIESISVGESEEPGLSRMVIVTSGDERTMEQVQKQLHKLIDVIKVQDLNEHAAVERELLLVTVGASSGTRMEINGIIEPFRASVVDVGPNSLMVQATGERSKLDALLDLLRPYGIKEVARTGVTALPRGATKGVAVHVGN
ncbi:MAG: acetolactate synthase small subunit [Firmicutes bacterium]|uniref:Acetolactate synthase small subunit n=1 Tax=Melghirimyces thermohalophilus TaxID=1236220 RepID=A0A1G6MNZ8_9BACL|nr:acetolactate synthase small subunit [Melghirimyces thermohalophilus]MDA8352040.1 acetolactate synthase small subunit [Bacillota bacterium]SDC57283.1 acetolactate synthase, small subunit [Melghirimyces thermohalophilus]